MLKMLLYFVVKLATRREENKLVIIFKNFITNVFLTLRYRLQERQLNEGTATFNAAPGNTDYMYHMWQYYLLHITEYT